MASGTIDEVKCDALTLRQADKNSEVVITYIGFPLFSGNVQDKNPKSGGKTPLYFAAEHGHFSICQMIIEKIEDKNPKSSAFDWTPLHCAALNGHFSICKLIMDNVEDKNPKGDFSEKFYQNSH